MSGISLAPQILFYIGAFPVTNTFFWSLFVFLFLIIGAVIFKTKLKMVPGKFQNIAEMLIGGAYDFVESITNDKKKAQRLFPLIFTMFFFAWLFMRVIFAPYLDDTLAGEYIAGMILLGIAPCTAMVLVWSYLARGFMGLTLVLVALNSLTMLVLYAPLGNFLLGVAEMSVPFMTIFLSVMLYVGVSLVAGYFSRTRLIKTRGIDWYERVFLKNMGTISIIALLATLVFLFMLQGGVILEAPLVVGMIAVPLIIQTLVIFLIGYIVAKFIGLTYEEAGPAAMIGASNHFEVAIATAVTIFGLTSGAALSTVVGVLIEVPIMLVLVRICLRTRNWFPAMKKTA